MLQLPPSQCARRRGDGEEGEAHDGAEGQLHPGHAVLGRARVVPGGVHHPAHQEDAAQDRRQQRVAQGA